MRRAYFGLLEWKAGAHTIATMIEHNTDWFSVVVEHLQKRGTITQSDQISPLGGFGSTDRGKVDRKIIAGGAEIIG